MVSFSTEKAIAWTCDFVGSYHKYQATNCCFSEDGSLLAVSFELQYGLHSYNMGFRNTEPEMYILQRSWENKAPLLWKTDMLKISSRQY